MVYLNTSILKQTRKSITFVFKLPPTSAESKFPLPTPCDNRKTEDSRGLADHGERYLYSDINLLASGYLWQYNTVPSQCEWSPWTWMWRIMYIDRWFNFDKCPINVEYVMCNQVPLQQKKCLLRRAGNIHYFFGELSILFLIILSWYTAA